MQGRVLPPPRIIYGPGKDKQKKSINAANGSWNMIQVQFAKPATLRSWAWIFIDEGRNTFWKSPNELSQSLGQFVTNLKTTGLFIGAPVGGDKVTGETVNIEAAIEKLQKTYNPDLILGILSSSNSSVYNTIKHSCDVRFGVHNVNVQAAKLVECQLQYCANVGLKFNLKLGGANQALESKDLKLFGDGKTMLVGIDVTHPSPGSSSNAPSVASMVSSVDASLAQWPAEVKIQTARQEMVSDLDELLKNRLRHWQSLHKSFPERIVVYRDGVSEGQYDTVIDKELPLLKKACKDLYPAKDTAKGLPRMAIMVVGKRHNTRFYPTSADSADKKGVNPSPGTVVDRGISESRHWDFYLQAHAALQGTARPAHYFTVWDEIFNANQPANPSPGDAVDVLQNITHNLCYLFGRATKAVSVCPPAYYADLVCTRARCYLSELFDPAPSAASTTGGETGQVLTPDTPHVEIHPKIRNTMFYI